MATRSHARCLPDPVIVAAMFVAMTALAGCAPLAGPRTDGWRPLFNGRDLAGWTVKCKPADQDKGFWQVEDGTILADSMGYQGHDYVWLVTDEEYSNFVLQLQFQAYRASGGNSGVQIRSRYDDQAGWLDGPQIDINPPGPWRTGMIWDETRGSGRWLYPDIPPGQWVDESMASPDLALYYADDSPGWNALEIKAHGTEITVILNGIRITRYNGAGLLDDDLHSRHNVGLTGHLALQIHRGDQLRIRFKDIRIKELPAR